MYASLFNSEPFDKSKIPSFFDLLTSSGYLEDVDLATDRWKLLAHNFETWRLAKTTEIVIPKHIHQIWVGSKIPSDYSAMCKVWQEKHPDWEYTLWGDEAYDLLDTKMHKDILKTKNYGIIGDVLRYQILHSYGGVYLDCDVLCVRNIEPLITNADFVSSLSNSRRDCKLMCYMMASVPFNPIIENVLKSIKIPKKITGKSHVYEVAASEKFTKIFHKSTSLSKHNMWRVIGLPEQFFAPVSLSAKKLDEKRDIEILRKYIVYETFGFHLSDMSWLKKKFIVIRLWKYFRRTVSLRKLVLAPKTLCIRLYKSLFR